MELIEGRKDVRLICRTCGTVVTLPVVSASMTTERKTKAWTAEQAMKDASGLIEGMEAGSALEAYDTLWDIEVVGPFPRCRC